MDILTDSKFTRDVDPISSARCAVVSGGKIANVTWFPPPEWRKGASTDPVQGSLFLEILGANVNGTECDLVF